MKQVFLDNDWEYIYRQTRRNTLTGIEEAAAGLTGMQAWFSATDQGATIHSDLVKNLSERASTPGEYSAILDGDVIRSRLSAYAGNRLFEVFGDGTNVSTSLPVRVLATRRPAT